MKLRCSVCNEIILYEDAIKHIKERRHEYHPLLSVASSPDIWFDVVDEDFVERLGYDPDFDNLYGMFGC